MCTSNSHDLPAQVRGSKMQLWPIKKDKEKNHNVTYEQISRSVPEAAFDEV